MQRCDHPPTTSMRHRYVDRRNGDVVTEQLYGDAFIDAIYSRVRETAPALYRAVITKRMSKLLGFLNYDISIGTTLSGSRRFLQKCGVDFDETVDAPDTLNTARKVFERKIRYWDCRPMPDDRFAIVSPADARVLV